MPLTSPRFKDNVRLQQAAENKPSIRFLEEGPAVAILQQAFIDLGFPMPKSTKGGSPDGVFGEETHKVVIAFQKQHGLTPDGVVGRQTMAKLDQLFPPGGPPTPLPGSCLPYVVPGTKTILAQPSPMSCWATVYCMMRSWKDQCSYAIRQAVQKAGEKWAIQYDKSFPPTKEGLPSDQFGAFLRDARMSHQPMMNLSIPGWVDLLKRRGLLWIGASVTVNPNTGLHSRILEGIIGTGEPWDTWMKIIDPDGGRRYDEPFMIFLAKYESGIRSVAGEYFQIRHF